jgi:hypothetical protein
MNNAESSPKFADIEARYKALDKYMEHVDFWPTVANDTDTAKTAEGIVDNIEDAIYDKTALKSDELAIRIERLINSLKEIVISTMQGNTAREIEALFQSQ